VNPIDPRLKEAAYSVVPAMPEPLRPFMNHVIDCGKCWPYVVGSGLLAIKHKTLRLEGQRPPEEVLCNDGLFLLRAAHVGRDQVLTGVPVAQVGSDDGEQRRAETMQWMEEIDNSEKGESHGNEEKRSGTE
jgi:hypothetical protein